jgi:GNAT superfamily N-acetyltransferase
MGQGLEVFTAETKRGRLAIAEVMHLSYITEIDRVPPPWARVLVVDDVPVSFILVDPDRQMEHSGGDLRYAFICDVATREDRRGEGHFRWVMEHTFSSLHAAGIPLVITHGRHQLYRRFGFDVFTHHCGIFVTPQQIEGKLGAQASGEVHHLLVVEERRAVQDDLLLVTEVKAVTLSDCKAALQAAAALARKRGKARILFEHPPAPSYGSRYPIYSSLETPFTALARACGAQVCVQGADPEAGSIPDADWIKVLDTATFLREALRELGESRQFLPVGTICFDTDAGVATIESTGEGVVVSEEIMPGAARVGWPSSALAQLVTGYQPVEVLSVIHNMPLPAETMALLGILFPQRWRLSRNESWTFKF